MILKRAGYFTGLIGKSNIPGLRQTDLDYYCGSDKTYLGFYPREQHGEFEVLFHGAEAETQIEMIGEVAEDFLGVDQGFYKRSFPEMQRYLARRPKDRPFFLLLGFEVPHGTGTRTMVQRPNDDVVRVFGESLTNSQAITLPKHLTSDELYRNTYRDQFDKMPIPANYVSWRNSRTSKLPMEIYNGEQSASYSYRWTPEGVREQQVRTCQTMSGVDRLLGQLRQRLEELGIADNTIVMYTSDHGLMHGEWGYGGKCLVYEPAIHVPLIIYDPRSNAGHGLVCDELVVSPDVAPTILDLCGLQAAASMQGQSLVPLIRGKSVPWREDIFLECLMLMQNYPLVQAVRGQRWKYTRYWPCEEVSIDYRDVLNRGLRGEPPAYEELFDLEEDPTERHNLASSPAHARRLANLRHRCVELLRESLGREPEAPLPSFRVEDWQEATKDYYETIERARGRGN
jgi:arylsulfatase A-like enzyme